MRTHIRKSLRGLLLAGGLALAGLLSALPAKALTVDLAADTATLTMPDGTPVTMWGYAISGDNPFDPGTGIPMIRATVTDNLQINLTNNLTVATSVVIPGQNDTTMNPAFFVDGQGRSRAESFTAETPAGGGPVAYNWPTLKAGTYLIHSGTHPGIQVPMGLYAVLIVDEVANTTAYTAQPGAINIDYDQEAIMLFSAVDSVQHQAVAAGNYGTAAYPTTMAAGYEADYFLVNGRPWGPDRSPMAAGILGSANPTLLRFLNAGIRDRVAVLPTGLLRVVAEDGNPFTTVGGSLQQYTQHSIDLPPLKTMDVTFTAGAAGYFPVFDRRLGLTNNNGPGGMLVYLQVDPAAPTNRTLTASIDGTITGTGSVQMISAPGGIDLANFVGGNSDNTESIQDGTVVTLRGTPEPGSGSMLTGWAVTDDGSGLPTGECTDPFGDCVVTMDADKTVTATFTVFTQMTLLSPNGGEMLPGGSAFTVRWGAPVGAVNFSLAYSLGAGTPWQTIATGITGNQYVWPVPNSVPNNGSVFIAVIGYDLTGNQIGMDVSDAPAQRTSVALLTPSATGIILTNGASYDITWSSALVSGNIAKAGLWYQTASGTAWQLITVLDGDPGTYTWTVPNSPSTQVKVGVILYDSLGNPLHLDVSDNMFEIQ